MSLASGGVSTAQCSDARSMGRSSNVKPRTQTMRPFLLHSSVVDSSILYFGNGLFFPSLFLAGGRLSDSFAACAVDRVGVDFCVAKNGVPPASVFPACPFVGGRVEKKTATKSYFYCELAPGHRGDLMLALCLNDAYVGATMIADERGREYT